MDPRMYMPWTWGQRQVPEPAGTPATKAQRKQIRRQAREADIPDTTVAKILRSDYGVDDLMKLDQNHAIDLMGQLGERLPNGILLREPHGKPTDAWMSSPSVVLPRSRAGARPPSPTAPIAKARRDGISISEVLYKQLAELAGDAP